MADDLAEEDDAGAFERFGEVVRLALIDEVSVWPGWRRC